MLGKGEWTKWTGLLTSFLERKSKAIWARRSGYRDRSKETHEAFDKRKTGNVLRVRLETVLGRLVKEIFVWKENESTHFLLLP